MRAITEKEGRTHTIRAKERDDLFEDDFQKIGKVE
jgi:hypothetical protein